jgi:hypothetical protein
MASRPASASSLRRYLPLLVAAGALTLAWLAVAVWVVAFGGPSSARAHRIDQTIVAGASVGGVSLGDPRGDVLGRLGGDPAAAHQRYSVGLLDVVFGRDGRVAGLATRSPRLRTPEGVGVGATLARVHAVYRRAVCAHGYCAVLTPGARTTFDTCGGARVALVSLAAPGAGPQLSCSATNARSNAS